jgi:hypothetical protein
MGIMCFFGRTTFLTSEIRRYQSPTSSMDQEAGATATLLQTLHLHLQTVPVLISDTQALRHTDSRAYMHY